MAFFLKNCFMILQRLTITQFTTKLANLSQSITQSERKTKRKQKHFISSLFYNKILLLKISNIRLIYMLIYKALCDKLTELLPVNKITFDTIRLLNI